MKINWSGRSHGYNKQDINYLVKIIKTADPLTQGKYLKKFEKDFSKWIRDKIDQLPVPKEQIKELIKKRMW